MLARLKPRSAFVRNAATLMAGTTIAQAIAIGFAPLMTRLFQPADYGLLAIFMSLVGMIAIVSTGRYSQAVILAKTDEDAANLCVLCFAIVLTLSLATLLVLIPFNTRIANAMGNGRVSHWLYLIPLAVLLGGVYEILGAWATRRGKFKRLATNRVGLATISSLIQVVLGWFRFGVSGLLFGYFNGQAMGVGVLGWQSLREDRTLLGHVSLEKIKEQASRFRNFPLYSLPADFIYVSTNQLPIVLFSYFVGPVAVGLYSLTQRVLLVPTGVVADSVTEVFKQRASSDFNKLGNCRDIYLKTFKSLSLVSILPFVLLALLAPVLFAFVFGEKWREAGEFVRVLSPMYFLKFTSGPLSYVYFIAGKQKEDLLLHIYMAVSSVASITLGYYLFRTQLYVMMCFSINYSIIYLIYLLRSYTFSKGDLSAPQEPFVVDNDKSIGEKLIA